jgi:hypothetical protein
MARGEMFIEIVTGSKKIRQYRQNIRLCKVREMSKRVAIVKLLMALGAEYF